MTEIEIMKPRWLIVNDPSSAYCDVAESDAAESDAAEVPNNHQTLKFIQDPINVKNKGRPLTRIKKAGIGSNSRIKSILEPKKPKKRKTIKDSRKTVEDSEKVMDVLDKLPVKCNPTYPSRFDPVETLKFTLNETEYMKIM